MADQRLPIVNSDDGTWGDILREYLLKEHYDGDGNYVPGTSTNGGHKTITIRAGTATAGTAPLKFTSGTLLTTPEAGAVEFNADSLYVTQTTGLTRKKVALYDDSSGATGDVYYRNSSGYFTPIGIGSNGSILTVSSGIPAWSSSATAGLVTGPGIATDNALARYDGTTGKLLQNSTATLDDSGNIIANSANLVGVGLGSGGFVDTTKVLNIDHTVVPGSDTYGVFSVLRENASTTNGNYHFGAYVVAQVVSGNAQNYTGGLRGANVIAEHNGTGTVAQAFGLETSLYNTSTGTISASAGLHINAPSNSGGGTITEYDSILIERPTAAATNRAFRTTGGDVVFNDFQSDSDFTIRTDNGMSTVFVEGSTDRVGIGNASPQVKLDVTGEIRASTAGTNVASVVTVGGTQTLTNKTLQDPTLSGAVTLPQNSIVNLYNTSDQVTNYEKAIMRYNSNVLEVGHIYDGTGVTRAARFGTSGAANNLNRYIQVQGSTPFISYQWSGTVLTGHAINIGSGNSFLAASGSQVALGIDPIINQSGTASYTGLLINPTETGTGSGSKLLIDAQVGGVSKFKVDNAGGVTTGNLSATSAVSSGISLTGNLSDTSSTVVGVSATANINPLAGSSATYRAFNMSATVPTTNSQTLTGQLYGAWIESRYQGTGSVGTIAGAYTAPVIPTAGQSFGTITNSYGLQTRGFIEFSGSSITGTVTNAISLQAVTSSTTNAGVDIQNAMGVDVQAQTYGSSSNIGVRIAKSDTYTLQLSDTGGTAAGGITFGTDTNLYRSAANTLKTDDNLIVGTVGTSAGSVVVIDGTQTLTNKTITGSRVDHLNDVNGNMVIGLYGIPSAVNQYYITNQSVGNYPTIGVDGSDTNIGIVFAPKGAGPVRIYSPAGQTPTIDVAGPDTNLNINLIPKGTGVVQQSGINVVTVSGSQTLTNKTISGSSNTLSNIALSSLTTTGTANSTTYLRGDGQWTAAGDTSTNTASSVDSEIALFSGTSGKTLKRATGSGIATVASGVLGTVAAPSGTIVGTTDSQTLTNKTLTNPTVNDYVEGTVVIGTVTTTHTFDLTNGTVHTATLTASTACTFTMPTAVAGKSFTVFLKQAASTGLGTATFTGVKWPGATAPTISPTAGQMDVLTFTSDGTNWYGTFIQGFVP